MSDKAPKTDFSGQEASETKVVEEETLVELRHLLIGPVEDQVDRIQERLDDTEVRSKEVGNILPRAIAKRSSEDDALASALSPTIVHALRFSIRHNLKSLADALFPVIGPAIRKAISEALRGMVQSLNEAMDKSFSLKGLKWRIEAYRTGKSFSEIMLLHSIVYRVEQLFLIHRKTGLLLRHLVTEETEFQDADMVSGMLTAIRDFVADSFRVDEREGLESIHVGELNVWIEHGPDAILAVVIRGTAPAALRSVMKETLEKVHLEFGDLLESFDGDTGSFEPTTPILEKCLVSQYREDKKKASPLLVAALGLFAVVLSTWIWFSLKAHFRWLDLLTALNGAEGIVITRAEREDGNYVIRGLRDSLAVNPVDLVIQAGIDPEQVTFYWTSYQALSDTIGQKRAVMVLGPPDSVKLTLRQGILTAEGESSAEWLAEAQKTAKTIAGISVFDTSGLKITDKEQIQAFQDYLRRLRMEKGIVITSSGIENGKFFIAGLLDPLAAKPSEILPSTKLHESNVTFSWEPYQSGDISIILKRAMKSLTPPKTVNLEVRDDCLVVSGAASNDWLVEMRRWIRTMPGNPCLDDDKVVNLDIVAMNNLRESIESENILFVADTVTPARGQLENMEKIAQEIRELTDLSKKLSSPVRIVIVGHTDRSGSEERNKKLSQFRADRIFEFFLSRGIQSNVFSIEAVGPAQPYTTENSEPGREKNRRVSFRISSL
jgi:outer membrane protein OmpA-like peptidoglycan-associated protein